MCRFTRRARRSRIFSYSSSSDPSGTDLFCWPTGWFTVDKVYNPIGIRCVPARTAHRTHDRRRFKPYSQSAPRLLLTGPGQHRTDTGSSSLPAGSCQRAGSRGWRARAHGRAADAPLGVCIHVPLRDVSRERRPVSRVPPLRIAAMHASATDIHVSVK